MYVLEISTNTSAKDSKLSAERNYLNELWEARLKVQAHADNLHAEGGKLYEHYPRTSVEGILKRAEGQLMRSEASFLRAHVCHQFFQAVFAIYGNVKMEWKLRNKDCKDLDCHLENGVVFEWHG